GAATPRFSITTPRPTASISLMRQTTAESRRPMRSLDKLRLTSGGWQIRLRRPSAMLIDALVFAGALALFYGIIAAARTWFSPFTPQVEIHRSPIYLPLYAGYSLFRIFIAYVLSLIFTLVYGYVAAYNPRAEKFMIPLLDVLQSIPVLSFLPG